MLDFMTVIKTSGVDQDFNRKKWGALTISLKKYVEKIVGH
jgi:hypothetical protein